MDDDINRKFKAGDLVYYKGYSVFPSEELATPHMGIVIQRPEGLPHASSYLIYWFGVSLTTRMHYDMIELVYEK
jgi:hypothetical protein